MGNKISHSFDPFLAEKYGLAESVFLSDVFFWVEHNKSHKINFKDGKYWTYSTNKAICERHPYWSRGQVDRIVKKLSDSGAILVGHYNKDPRDRTNWYTLGNELFEYFFGESSCEKTMNATTGIRGMESMKSCNEESKIVEPLPYTYTNCIHKDFIPPTPNKKNQNQSTVEIPTKEQTFFSDRLQKAFEEWIQYKLESKFKYTSTGMKALVKKLESYAEKYGSDAVVSILQDAMASGYKGPVWDKLEKQAEIIRKQREEKKYQMPDWNDDSLFLNGRNHD